MKKIIAFSLSLLLLISCSDNTQKKINKIPVSFSIERFDSIFFSTSHSEFHTLKRKYPFFFSPNIPDSIWIDKQKDSMQQVLHNEIKKKFTTLADVKNDLRKLFQHILFYFPDTEIPRVISLQNNIDYQVPIIYTPKLLLISLDTYLGAENELYIDIPQYISRQMDAPYITSHVANDFLSKKALPPENRTLLAKMIFYGKQMYIHELLLPKMQDTIRLGYTYKQLEWTNTNEQFIWDYFVENELFYKTAPTYSRRFIDIAPFSKFYLSIDNQTPGGIGKWLGYKIVKAYMRRNKVSLETLLKTPSEIILTQSKYKPKR